MYYLGKWIYHFITQLGFDPLQSGQALRGLPAFIRNYFRFQRARPPAPREFAMGRLHPCLADRFSRASTARGHYFHQDLWVAQRIFSRQPKKHVDVGSRVDGFVAHVAAFQDIEAWDIRPPQRNVNHIRFRQVDFMQTNAIPENYCDSVSCLSVLEHFGLGRYGDAIDWQGHLKGWRNLHRMLTLAGQLYFSVPIGPQRIEFDAHRVFSMDYLLQWLKPHYQLDAFVYVNDQGDLVENAVLEPKNIQNNFSCFFGCGIFALTKIA